MEIGDSGGTKVAQEKTELKTPSLAEELDNLMDISIEIASNKRMKKDYIKPFKLTFKDKDLEKKVSFSHQRTCQLLALHPVQLGINRSIISEPL